MSKKSRTIISAAALTLGFAALCVVIVLTTVNAVGTDDALYYSYQTMFDKLPSWDVESYYGISPEALKLLDSGLSDYLNGDETALEMSVSVNGTPQPAFNDRERLHMADCFNLFALLRKVRSRLIPWVIVLILGGAWLNQDRHFIRRCAWIGVLVALLPLAGFAVYALMDFDAAFVTFHRLLFSNELWRLNPATDLLIRICPERMFMGMGVRIAAYSLAGILGSAGIVTALTALWPRRRGENAWKTTTRRGFAHKRIDLGGRGTR